MQAIFVPPNLQDLIPLSEAARRLELSGQRLRALAKEGRVPCVMTPLGRLFDPADIERFRRTRGPFGRYGPPRSDAGLGTPPQRDGPQGELGAAGTYIEPLTRSILPAGAPLTEPGGAST